MCWCGHCATQLRAARRPSAAAMEAKTNKRPQLGPRATHPAAALFSSSRAYDGRTALGRMPPIQRPFFFPSTMDPKHFLHVFSSDLFPTFLGRESNEKSIKKLKIMIWNGNHKNMKTCSKLVRILTNDAKCHMMETNAI